MGASTIGLNMIIKNEASVIRRCLDSVLPFIKRRVIVDTGSMDGTQELVREHMMSKPGVLHERPWKSFGHNRNEALQLAGEPPPGAGASPHAQKLRALRCLPRPTRPRAGAEPAGRAVSES